MGLRAADALGSMDTAHTTPLPLNRCMGHRPDRQLTIGQRAQDAQKLHAGILLGELLEGTVPGGHVRARLFPRPRHEHLHHMLQAPQPSSTCCTGRRVGWLEPAMGISLSMGMGMSMGMKRP